MEKVQITMMSDHSEIVSYDNPGIPLYIKRSFLSSYPGRKAQCHWHDDIELVLILKGEMNYYISGETVLLKEMDCILIHAKNMHYGFSVDNKECCFICILFHPSLLSSCAKLTARYVTPFLERNDLPYLHFRHDTNQEIQKLILQIEQLKNVREICYEMDIIGQLFCLWSTIQRQSKTLSNEATTEPSPDVIALRKMVSYIHEHYRETISLKDIANAANVCKSNCCNIFKYQIQQSPFVFLNQYRLQVSASLLQSSTRSITQIAFDCGFNHLSYYSKQFLRYFGCTPTEYRHKTKKASL